MSNGFGVSTNWSSDNSPIVAPNEDHMALLFLCDISGSMTLEAEGNRRRIDLLNDALSGFAPIVCADAKTARSLEVGIVAFDHNQKVVQPFTNVNKMKEEGYKPLVSEGGGTKIAAAAQFALDMLNAHAKRFQDEGVRVRKPWVFMITDGAPQHDSSDELDSAISRVREMDAAGKLRFFSFGVGEFDADTLRLFSGERAFAIQGYDFSKLIDWTAKSMRSISTAAPGDAAPPPAPIRPEDGLIQLSG